MNRGKRSTKYCLGILNEAKDTLIIYINNIIGVKEAIHAVLSDIIHQGYIHCLYD